MSHFYLYPLLLSQGYSTTQISLILHSYGLNSSFHHELPMFPFLQFERQNNIGRLIQETNFIVRPPAEYMNNGASGNSTQLGSHDGIQIKQPSNQLAIKQQPLQKYDGQCNSEAMNEQNQGKQKNVKKSKKKKIKKISLKQKREKQMKRNQTQNSKRNIIPNEIHQMLSILFKKKKSTHLVDRLIQRFSALKSNHSISTQRFYLYQGLLKQKINHYANQESLKILKTPLEPEFKIYSQQQQQIYTKIGLILINYFLHNQATLIILNSQRIKSENKLDHLKTKRYLAYVLNDIILSNKSS